MRLHSFRHRGMQEVRVYGSSILAMVGLVIRLGYRIMRLDVMAIGRECRFRLGDDWRLARVRSNSGSRNVWPGRAASIIHRDGQRISI